MSYLTFLSQYNKNPKTVILGYDNQSFTSIAEIVAELKTYEGSKICFETYPGVNTSFFVEQLFSNLNPQNVICSTTALKSKRKIDSMIKRNLTNDRVFGYLSNHIIEDFYDHKKLKRLSNQINETKGTQIIYGFGASLLPYDVLVYVSLSRWEIQKRYRNGQSNFNIDNESEDILRKYKRGFFVEWRVADRLKQRLFEKVNYMIDANQIANPKMLTLKAYQQALSKMVSGPFRLVPYFDPGVWGGQWMKEVCNLDSNMENYAWCFDGVPEENSVKYVFKNTDFEFPAIDIVFFQSIKLLGEHVYNRFGAEFPIRFDLLDTMQGGHLSLQVHPLKSYIKEQFGMSYTQDESYYILDVDEGASVYLGLKENVDKKAMINDLKKASKGDLVFDAEKYVNYFPVKKHDHISIPAGTIHCSGLNTMVLEISATPYIFTFKLWDWNRLGLDGKPRPVHLKHGLKSIQYDRDTSWVKKRLINPVKNINSFSEITGLDETQFIETRRYRFIEAIEIYTHESVNVFNLVQGKRAVIKAINGEFEDFIVNYAETVIIPANIEKFMIESFESLDECTIIKAHVKNKE